MLDFQTLKDLLTGRSRDELATVAAYLLAPGLVAILAGAGVYTPGMGVDFAKPVAVSELITEASTKGEMVVKKGIVLTLEPVDAEYQIPLASASSIWISVTPEILRANSDRLTITEHGFRGKSPLIGVSDPVTVVVQGAPGKEIFVPGGTERLESWKLQSRRSVSLVSSALLACVFAFGMAIATGLPPMKTPQHNAGEIRAKANKREII
jgi:hypothetical protein